MNKSANRSRAGRGNTAPPSKRARGGASSAPPAVTLSSAAQEGRRPTQPRRKATDKAVADSSRDIDAETASVLATARSWFTPFDDADQIALIASYVRDRRAAAQARWKVETERGGDNRTVLLRKAELALRAAAIEVLFEVPGLLRRPELFSHPDFAWIIDGLFLAFQQRDLDVLRQVVQRGRGRPETLGDALQTRYLVDHALTADDAFRNHLRTVIETTDADGVSDAERSSARRRLRKLEPVAKRPKKQAIEEVAKFEGITTAAVISRLRKASRS